jgi:hypothetical protein
MWVDLARVDWHWHNNYVVEPNLKRKGYNFICGLSGGKIGEKDITRYVGVKL